MRWRVPGWGLGVSRDDHIQKALRSLATAEGEQFRLSPKTGRLVPATRGSSGPFALGQHDARLLAGGAVDVVVAEEDLRGGGLAVGAGDTVGLAFGGLDHQEDTAVVGQGLVQLEGEGVTLARDGGSGWELLAPSSIISSSGAPTLALAQCLPGDYGPWGGGG